MASTFPSERPPAAAAASPTGSAAASVPSVRSRRSRRPRFAAALSIGVTAIALAACGSGGSAGSAGSLPKVDDFSAGPCRAMAPGLIDVLRTARQDPANAEPRALSAALTPPQKSLHALQPGAGQFGPALQDVTTTIGFVRLRADSRTYDPALLVNVKQATETLVARCTSNR